MDSEASRAGAAAVGGVGIGGTVLVVDDLERPRRALANELEDAGFDVVQASNGIEGWQHFCLNVPDVVVTDMAMPKSDGLELLDRIRSCSDVPVIVFTAHGTVQAAAAAFKTGADDFLASTEVEIDDLVELVGSIARGVRRPSLESDPIARAIAGESRIIHRLRERVAGVAALSTPVLLCGEAGSGRDAIARVLHEAGSTREGRFVSVLGSEMKSGDRIPDCEFFYLDGLEQVDLSVQKFLLEWIESCAEHDFAYGPRLAVSTIGTSLSSAFPVASFPLRAALVRFALDLPPLREIRDDLSVIADHLTARVGDRLGRSVKLSPSTRDFVREQPWPGNAAQLERVLERAIAFTRGRHVRRDVVREVLDETQESLDSIREANDRVERELLIQTLRETNANVSRTAEILGKSRTAVYRLIEKNGIPISRKAR